MSKEEGGIYLHVPFCANKCLYCDFYSGGARIADWALFIKSISQELKLRKSELNFHDSTLYIGGGTPSLIPPQFYYDLIRELQSQIEKDSWEEFTLEVNPEDINETNTRVWKETGVNRISVGIQSFNNRELKAIGRRHELSVLPRQIDLIKKEFENISIDLIYGLPFQTVESYRYSLKKAKELDVNHISVYSLMLEENTALTHLAKLNKLKLPQENEWLEMSHLTVNFLEENGYNRYEISNYCKPGYESRHNNYYWSGNPYIGLGPSAHSYDGNLIRRFNPNDLKGYLKFYGNYELNKNIRGTEINSKINKLFYEEETLSMNEKREENIMTRLRTVKGLLIEEFSSKFGNEAKENLLQNALKYKKSGHLKEEGDRLSLTEKGFLIYNTVLSDLI